MYEKRSVLDAPLSLRELIEYVDNCGHDMADVLSHLFEGDTGARQAISDYIKDKDLDIIDEDY